MLQAELLKQGQAHNPVAQTFLMSSKSCNIFRLEEEAIVDVPWRSLDLTLLLHGVLVGIASHTRVNARLKKASSLRGRRRENIRTRPFERDPPP